MSTSISHHFDPKFRAIDQVSGTKIGNVVSLLSSITPSPVTVGGGSERIGSLEVRPDVRHDS